jgi:paired amphipathic helix protein Sin3a
VYTNIQYLFAGHDDLLEDFKQFLPEVQEPRGFKRVMKTQASSIHTKKRKTYVSTSFIIYLLHFLLDNLHC